MRRAQGVCAMYLGRARDWNTISDYPPIRANLSGVDLLLNILGHFYSLRDEV